jgi:hypothetical protein
MTGAVAQNLVRTALPPDMRTALPLDVSTALPPTLNTAVPPTLNTAVPPDVRQGYALPETEENKNGLRPRYGLSPNEGHSP